MTSLFLTPASIGYLSQFILSLAIFLYLAWQSSRYEKKDRQLLLLLAVFAAVTVFVGLLFLDATLLPAPRLYAVYLENTILGILLLLIIQFAYHFPAQYPQHRIESYLALLSSGLYALYEAYYACYRYYELLSAGNVNYRPAFPDLVLAVIILWVPIAFLRQCVAADAREAAWWKKLWNPQGREARTAQLFARVFAIFFLLGIVNLLRTWFLISTTFYNISLSIGILVMLGLFALNYINYLPGPTSFFVRLAAVALTLQLAILGTIGWLAMPTFVGIYRPIITDKQTLHFEPDTQGGFTISQAPFSFETELGEKLSLSISDDNRRNQEVAFAFPFNGKTYDKVFVSNSGVVCMGEGIYHPNLQYDPGYAPCIFPLMVDLLPETSGGVFARVAGDRLIVTADHVPAAHQPKMLYTFQTVLHPDGSFDITYNGLPDPIAFNADATPSANPWFRGVTLGRGRPIVQTTDLSQPSQNAGAGIIQNYFSDFRSHIHHLILPVAWMVLGGSLLLLAGLPLFMYSAFTHPLAALLEGVRKMDEERLDTSVPVFQNDEIGTLAQAYNKMLARIHSLVADLEGRVAERTFELENANEQLHVEIQSRLETQEQLIAQQRELAVMEERQRLARDLHDSVNQSIHSLSLFAETLSFLLERGNVQRSLEISSRLQESARQALKEARLMLYQLRPSEEEAGADLLRDIEARLAAVERRAGLKASVIVEGSLDNCPELWRKNLFWITIEALNNSLKHAQARTVSVILRSLPESLELTIADDGIGFDETRVRAGGMGLRSMYERAELIGGQLLISSETGKGSSVIVRAEIKEQA
jgi:signal transduction histidine kinase